MLWAKLKAFWLYNYVVHFLDIPIYNLHIYKMSLPHGKSRSPMVNDIINEALKQFFKKCWVM